MTKKLVGVIFIIIMIVFMSTIVNAKYMIENEFEVANLNIDKTKPIIEIISIKNTNTGYENYANKNHIISLDVRFKDKNIDKVFCDKEHVKVKIEDTYIEAEEFEFTKINEVQGEKIYKIQLKNLYLNGKLKIEFLEGTVIDTGGLKNDKFEIDTNIIIDNIAPNGVFVEEKIEDGRVTGIINLSENIRTLEGWQESKDKLKVQKEFTNNISYELPITDYAGNKSIVNVNITKASYINLIYASHNSEVGWTFGYGNYDIAGKEAIDKNPIYKTEALAFNFSGNLDADFVQAKAYIHTYWGEGAYRKCETSGIIYNHGYNPNDGTYKSMNSNDLVTLQGKKYLQLGGDGMNCYNKTAINVNNPIPYDVAHKYQYGISGIILKLKDYSKFSIIYQIYVNEVGWVKACSDGEECMYSNSKPMSAFRIALVPNTEKQYVIDTWNKDI